MKNWITEYSIWVLLIVSLVLTIKADMKFVSGVVIGVLIIRIVYKIFEKRD